MSSVLYDVPGPKARRISLIGSIVGSLLILGLLASGRAARRLSPTARPDPPAQAVQPLD